MGIHKGTKLTDTPKDRTLKVRFDEQTEKRLNAICEQQKVTKAQAIRNGIDMQYKALKK